MGDWNDRLDDIADRNVFLPFLTSSDRYAFLTWPLAQAGESSYIPFAGLIDHILITSGARDEYGPGTTEVVPIEQLYPNYLRFVSDHRPVVSRFLVR